jgi:DNA-binding response OmpR family regulator
MTTGKSILESYAKKEGFTPLVAENGEKALSLFEQYNPSIVLFDVMMPEKDGFTVCREIRRHSNVPVIMITARSEDFDRIMGLDIGADDYIVKPFSPGEVMARVRAILRRIERNDEKEKKAFEVDNLTIHLDDYTVKIGNQALMLTKKEIKLLWTLATKKTRCFHGKTCSTVCGAMIVLVTAERWTPISKAFGQSLTNMNIPSGISEQSGGVGYKFDVL